MQQRPIELYTDGAAKGNPGPGGFGTILRFGKHEKEFSAGFRKTTNNRMELLAVIIGLEAIKSDSAHPVVIYSDSKYVVDSIAKRWVHSWVTKGFKGKKNKDLWLRYLRAAEGKYITIQWIKGHAGHPENERCDRLAVAASEQVNLPPDEAYEQSENEESGIF